MHSQRQPFAPAPHCTIEEPLLATPACRKTRYPVLHVAIAVDRSHAPPLHIPSMAQTRRTRARSPAAPLDPPAPAPNEPTEADPSPPSTSSIPQTPASSSPAKPKRKRPVEPNYAKLEEKAARAKRAKFAAVEVGGSGANGSTMGSAEGAAERMRLVGKTVKLQEGQSDYTISASGRWTQSAPRANSPLRSNSRAASLARSANSRIPL